MSEPGEEQFIPALSHEDEIVRGYAARLLGIAGEREVLPYLLEALESGSGAARRAAVQTLGDLGNDDAAPGLVAALSDPDGDTRASAARSLGKMTASAAVPSLELLLADSHEAARASAAWALGETGDSSAGPAIVPLIDNESVLVRREAVRSLGKLKERGAIPGLETVDRLVDFRCLQLFCVNFPVPQGLIFCCSHLNARSDIMCSCRRLESRSVKRARPRPESGDSPMRTGFTPLRNLSPGRAFPRYRPMPNSTAAFSASFLPVTALVLPSRL